MSLPPSTTTSPLRVRSLTPPHPHEVASGTGTALSVQERLLLERKQRELKRELLRLELEELDEELSLKANENGNANENENGNEREIPAPPAVAAAAAGASTGPSLLGKREKSFERETAETGVRGVVRESVSPPPRKRRRILDSRDRQRSTSRERAYRDGRSRPRSRSRERAYRERDGYSSASDRERDWDRRHRYEHRGQRARAGGRERGRDRRRHRSYSPYSSEEEMSRRSSRRRRPVTRPRPSRQRRDDYGNFSGPGSEIEELGRRRSRDGRVFHVSVDLEPEAPHVPARLVRLTGEAKPPPMIEESESILVVDGRSGSQTPTHHIPKSFVRNLWQVTSYAERNRLIPAICRFVRTKGCVGRNRNGKRSKCARFVHLTPEAMKVYQKNRLADYRV